MQYKKCDFQIAKHYLILQTDDIISFEQNNVITNPTA